jgi:hypothetical protein
MDSAVGFDIYMQVGNLDVVVWILQLWTFVEDGAFEWKHFFD